MRAVFAAARDPAVRLAECREWTGLIDRHSDVELEPAAGSTEIQWLGSADLEPDPDECEFRRGALEALLRDPRGQLATIHHPVCRASGGDGCVYLAQGLEPRRDELHAELFWQASLLSAGLQGRELRSGPAEGGIPQSPSEIRELDAVRRLMEDSDSIVLVFDRTLAVLEANSAAVEFSGIPRELLCGLSARDLLSVDSLRRVREKIPLLREHGVQRGLPAEGRTRSGWAPLELALLASEGTDAVVCIARDVSAQLRMERELAERTRQLRAQSARLREADLLKSEFLANMSHELTTPLTSIRGFARMLRGDLEAELEGSDTKLLPEKRLEFLRILAVEAERMQGLIAGLLELSQIESGGVTLDRARVSLNTLVRDCLVALEPRLQERRQRLVLRLSPDLPQALLDPDRIKQALLHLLQNAERFSPAAAEIEVETAALAGMVELSVTNPARGASEEQLELMFEPFIQRDGSYARAQGGVGLGLNLVRAITELHGGKAWADLPEPGRIRFRLRVPIAAEL